LPNAGHHFEGYFINSKHHASTPTNEKHTGLYFISPREPSVKRLVRDFARPNEPQFKTAHVFFSGNFSDDVLKKIEKSPLLNRLKTLKELASTDFYVQDSRTFSCQREVLSHMFWPEVNKEGVLSDELKKLSRQIVAMCVSSQQLPFVRYMTQTHGGKHNETLAKLVQAGLAEAQQKLGETFKPNPKRGTLVIFNRSLDPAAPLMHEFTYEAQVYDLLYRDEHGIVHLTPPPAPTPVPVVQDAKSVAADRKAPVVEKKAEKDEKKKNR